MRVRAEDRLAGAFPAISTIRYPSDPLLITAIQAAARGSGEDGSMLLRKSRRWECSARNEEQVDRSLGLWPEGDHAIVS
jgi:hypothetical protein